MPHVVGAELISDISEYAVFKMMRLYSGLETLLDIKQIYLIYLFIYTIKSKSWMLMK